MSNALAVHLFGASPGAEAWSGASVESAQEGVPAERDIRAALAAAKGPVAFAMAGKVRPEDLAGAGSVDADCTVIVADPSAQANGRASADLVAMMWQTAPAAAVLLGESLLGAGAVVLSARGLARAKAELPDLGDPLALAASEIARGGGTLRAMLLPGESQARLAPAPPELSPADPPEQRRWVAEEISRSDPGRLLDKTSSHADAMAVSAGLLLWHDFLDESHAVSQSLEGQGRHRAADYWHAIMHRREPDYGNAKYWFRRVNQHPAFDPLAARAERLAAAAGPAGARLLARVAPGGNWDPLRFVDVCEEVARSPDPDVDFLLRRFQADEMLLLLWQTCQDARG
jgi:hypothetical protein